MLFVPPEHGEVASLSRRLSTNIDGCSLYSALCDDGNRDDTWILESTDTSAPNGRMSLIGVDAALRIECRGHRVCVHALSENGRTALAHLGAKLATVANITPGDEELRLEFPQKRRDTEDQERLRAPSPVDVLRVAVSGWKLRDLPHSRGFLIAGMFAYEFLDVYEELPSLPSSEDACPDFAFWLPETVVLLDHLSRSCHVLAHVFGGPASRLVYNDAIHRIQQVTNTIKDLAVTGSQKPSSKTTETTTAEVDIDDASFSESVRSLKTHIRSGDVYQIVASRAFTAPCPDPLVAYRRLRSLNPSPYMYFLRAPSHALFGSSPETCIRVDDERNVEISPIAGTRPRGLDQSGTVDVDLDARIEAELRSDSKETAEHMMLVDLARNDVSRVSVPGTTCVDQLMTVGRYSHVMHLVSRVRGRLRDEFDALHAYVAAMNMGTLVGAPKIKAAEILRSYEPHRRGYYGGAVGYLTSEGEMDTAIIIRSALVTGDYATVRAGAGIVHDSDPLSETAETTRKARAVLSALNAEFET